MNDINYLNDKMMEAWQLTLIYVNKNQKLFKMWFKIYTSLLFKISKLKIESQTINY